jgi:hypothetical protein
MLDSQLGALDSNSLFLATGDVHTSKAITNFRPHAAFSDA